MTGCRRSFTEQSRQSFHKMKSAMAHNRVLTYCDNAGVVHTRRWAAKCLAVLLCLACLVSFSACSERKADPEEELDPSSIEYLLKKPNLKVLDIGNSYSVGVFSLLPAVVKYCKADVNDMCLYELYRSGSSFRTWCNLYEDKDTQHFSFYRVIGNLTVNVPYGVYPERDGSVFRRVLTEVEWDLIIIHQVSTYAPYYDSWAGEGIGGFLEQLLGIIRQHQPRAKIGFMLVHSYWDCYSGNKERSSFERWQLIANSVQQLQRDYDIQFIIPYGTAVENLRFSSLNNDYDLTKDGTHLEYGLSQYTAACCLFESLITPRTGISCLGSPALIDVSDTESLYPSISVNKKNALIAQKAAILAVKDMFHCNNPEN